MERRAKIVCTLGPSSSTPELIDSLIKSGMDVARLNFSHGTREEHAARVAAVRRASAHYEKSVAIIADLQGPKIRTGALERGVPVQLHFGQKFTITTRKIVGTSEGVSTTFRELPHAVHKGDRILLSDGNISLRVISTRGSEVVCQVENGGELREHQGINLPGVRLKIPSLTPKDRRDLAFALTLGVNYVALSFVRTARDVRSGKAAIRRHGVDIPVIAKLEKPEAIDNLAEILAVADCVMVARGDLGVEMNPEKVPVVQKQIIMQARDALVPVITATQMLDSMQENPRPTRAEASDVANAIFDGSDALMLSGETAAGHYPLESVVMMDRIIREAEANANGALRPKRSGELMISETIAEAICHADEDLHMKAIAVFTEGGGSARLVSKYRPRAPIIAFSPSQNTRRQMSLLWGVLPRSIARVHDIDRLAKTAERRLKQEHLVKDGDIVGVIAGTPLGTRGSTNLMRLIRIGD
ncbi:MAG TPA: pyruvate kinase [Candidatus Acidoferrales bacterium]|jgi:pyruvate kinase|nr:pyruvate kinase [Candidatus Acidoferrales bacterium]